MITVSTLQDKIRASSPHSPLYFNCSLLVDPDSRIQSFPWYTYPILCRPLWAGKVRIFHLLSPPTSTRDARYYPSFSHGKPHRNGVCCPRRFKSWEQTKDLACCHSRAALFSKNSTFYGSTKWCCWTNCHIARVATEQGCIAQAILSLPTTVQVGHDYAGRFQRQRIVAFVGDSVAGRYKYPATIH